MLALLLAIAWPSSADISGGNLTWQVPSGYQVTATSSAFTWIYYPIYYPFFVYLDYLSMSTPSYPQGTVPAAISLNGSVSLKDAGGNLTSGTVYFVLTWYDCSSDTWDESDLGSVYAGATGHRPFSFTWVVPNPCPSSSSIYVEFTPAASNETAVIDSTDQFTMSWQSH